jgi:hypothetical protein
LNAPVVPGMNRPGLSVTPPHLSPARITEIAADFIGGDVLAACLASPEIEQKLQQDTALANDLGIKRSPAVVVNGRRVSPSAPLLQTLILTRVAGTHPAFSALPLANRGRDEGDADDEPESEHEHP